MPTPPPDRSNIATGVGQIPTKKTTKKKSSTKVNAPAPGSVPVTGYDWGDGKGAKHTITLKQHQANVNAKALTPYDIGGGYDPANVRTTVNSAMDLEYGQPIATQQNQIDASQRNIDVNIPAWYQQYIDAVGAARQATAMEYKNAAAASGGAVPQMTGDPTMDAAAQNRAALANSFQGLVNTQGANTTAMYDNQGANAALMRIGSLQEEGRNQQTLQAGLGQLQKEKGEYGNTYLQKLREGAQQLDSDNKASEAAVLASGQKLDFDQNGIADTVDAANASANAQSNRLDNQITKWGYTNREWREMSPEQRESIRKAQAPPKAGKENSKDYYGHSWNEWKHMSPSKRRSAAKLWAESTNTGGKKGGPTDVQAGEAQSQFKFALDWFRKNTKGGVYTDQKTGKTGDAVQTMRAYADVEGQKVDYQVAKILQHWASNGGKITKDEYNTLRKKGVPEKWLIGHVE